MCKVYELATHRWGLYWLIILESKINKIFKLKENISHLLDWQQLKSVILSIGETENLELSYTVLVW